MIVYRVENQGGEGPYVSQGATDYQGHPHRPSPRNPGEPWYEGQTQSYRFGFASVTAFNKWFPDRSERYNMDKYGHRLVMYEVPENSVKTGVCQLIFEKAYAKIAMVLDLTDPELVNYT